MKTSRAHARATRSLALPALAAALACAACDPTPDYPPPDPTLPGLIEAEADLVARDGDALEFAVDNNRVALSIPAGALPAGTRVKVRSLVGIDNARMVPGVRVFYPWQGGFGWAAIEILPESLVFAQPATLTLPFTYDTAAGAVCVDVLFSHPTDSVWQRVGYGTVSAPDFYKSTAVTASLTGGGLWSLAYTDGCPTADGGADASAD